MSAIQSSVHTLSTMTGLSETELQRRAQELVSSGRIKGLTALEWK